MNTLLASHAQSTLMRLQESGTSQSTGPRGAAPRVQQAEECFRKLEKNAQHGIISAKKDSEVGVCGGGVHETLLR